MTTEKYLLNRVLELESEVNRLKEIIENREIRFLFEDKGMKDSEYRIVFNNENGTIKIIKE